jgi:hypothetical protein
MILALSLSPGGGAPTIDGEDGEYRDAWRGLEEDYKYSSVSQPFKGNVFIYQSHVHKFDTGYSDFV